MALSYFAPALGIVHQVAVANGVDSAALLRAWGIDPDGLDAGDRRLRIDQVLGYLEAVEQALLERDPAAGLAANEYWHPSKFGPLGYAWLTSDSLVAAFRRLERYSRIVSEGVQVGLKADEEELVVSFDFVQSWRAPLLRNDVTLASVLAMCRNQVGPDFIPERVELAHPPPADREPYEALFRCPLSFDRAVSALVVAREQADRRSAVSYARMERLHDQVMVEYLAHLSDDEIVERARVAIREVLPSGELSDAAVADKLHLSSRTLQRRLKAQGTSFKALLTEVRTELADQFLRENRHSLSEIAFLLGFSELSAFSRAFRRWKGVSPSQYRGHGGGAGYSSSGS